MPAAVKGMFHPHRSNRPKRLERPPPKRLVGPFPCTNGVAMTDLGAMGFQPFAKKKCDEMGFQPLAIECDEMGFQPVAGIKQKISE